MLSKQRLSAPRNSSGFSLLEVMIALSIISVILLTCYKAINSALITLGDMQNMNRAISLSKRLFAETTLNRLPPGDSSGLESFPNANLFWTRSIQPESQTGLYRISIRIVMENAPEKELYGGETLIESRQRTAESTP